MDCTRLCLFLVVCFAPGVNGLIRTVDFFSLCGNGNGYEKSISDTDKLAVTMYGYNWPTGKTSCTVVFKASQYSRKLQYTFKKFELTNEYTKVETKEAVNILYYYTDTYSKYLKPDLGKQIVSLRYTKFIVTRLSTSDTSLSARFDINTNEFDKPDTVTYSGSNYNYSDDYDGIYYTSGRITGIALGSIVAVIFIVIAVIWGMSRNRGRAYRGATVLTGNVSTITRVNPVMCSYVPPPANIAMPPAYPYNYPPPAYPPPAYPTQSGVYPSA